jgi:two-component system response regulator FlrC
MRAEVAAGRFREDLYYRLSVFPLQWLPLRQRRLDIPALAARLLGQHAARMGRGAVHFDATAIRSLSDYNWPGNVRELDNVVQRALILQPGPVIGAADLCLDPFAAAGGLPAAMPFTSTSIAAAEPPESEGVLGDDLQRREFEIILNTLRNCDSKKSAAERLGISPRTLRYKLARMREAGMELGALAQGI